MMRLCFPLVVLLHGIVANQSDCPMDSDGIQRCSENLVVDDSTALMQNRGFRLPAEMLQLSNLLTQKGVADRSNVASMAGKMRELAVNSVNSTNGQGINDEVKTVLRTVKEVQIKAILDSVQSEHDNELKLLNQATASIETCNAVVKEAFQTGGGINDQAAGSAQKGEALSECRTAEKDALGIKTEKCTDYDQFLIGLQNIPPCAGNLPVPGPKLLKCKKDIEAWSNSYTAASYEAKQADCTAKTSEHAMKKSECDADQAKLEEGYCAYGQVLTTTCAEQTTCFEQQGNAKQEICTNAHSAAGLRQTEYIASKKVVCYIDVLVSDDEPAAKKAALQECDKAVDATSLEIECPDTPSKGTCKTDVLLPKPCDDCAECTIISAHPAPVQSVEASTASMAASPAPITGLLHHFDFEDDSMLDVEGKATVTPFSSPSFVAGAPITNGGTPSKGLHMIANKKIRVSTTQQATEFSHSFWFSPDSTSTRGTPRLDFHYATSGGHGVNCYTCHHVTAQRSNVQAICLYHSHVCTSTETFEAGKWYHIAFIQSATKMAVYVNGQKENEKSRSPSTATGNAFSIGTGAGAYVLDDVGYWSKALSDSELQSVYRNGIAHAR